MLTLICYDIVQTKRRTNVMKLLKGYGTRVQRSVFECDLDAVGFAALRRQLQALIHRQRALLPARCSRCRADFD